jgi:hypothetical protein
MGTRQESPEKDIWWMNELESLGVTAKPRNDLQEISRLIENIKQILITHTNPHTMPNIQKILKQH